MTEKTLEVKGASQNAEKAEVGKKLFDDTLTTHLLEAQGMKTSASNSFSGLTSNAWGRRAYALAEGISLSPHGFLRAAEENWNDKWGLAGKVATGVAFGVGMRFLLPRAGAAKALVGTVMGAMFIKDAVTPLYKGSQAAAVAENMDELHAASRMMGDGLGHFYFDTGIGIATGLVGEKATGAIMDRTRTGRSIDAWKDRTFNSKEGAIGRFFKWSEETADQTSGRLSERILGKEPVRPDLPIAEKFRLIEEAQHHQARAYDVERVMGDRRRYNTKEFSERIDALLGHNREAATAAGALDIVLAHGDNASGTGGPKSFRTGGKEIPIEIPGGKDTPIEIPINKEPKLITDGVKPVTKPTGPVPEMSAENVGNMAVTVRNEAGRVSKEDILVAGLKEDFKGPPIGVTRSGASPLDPNHAKNIGMLIDLINQIQNKDHVRQAGMLLDHHRTALQQVELAAAGKRGGIPEINDLNMYSRSIHVRMLQMLDEAGIPRSVVRGENSPLFTIRDADGAGPYTIPAIPKVTDAAVVTLPREYQKMLGTHVSGVYPHELGHDLVYGDLLRFPKNLRDHVLTDRVVGKAMERAGIADTPVEIPGVGPIKKSELFVQVLKAQANENTADMFGTSIDPNTGLSLAVLLSSLRKAAPGAPKGSPGLLENRSVFGKEMIDAEMGNHLGFEVHGFDSWRIKLSAQTMRELANGHKGVLQYADRLDKLADGMSRPGENYVWASLDNEGAFISIPRKEWDSIIPALVKAQLDTPLEALGGKTLRVFAPNMGETFTKVDGLAGLISDAALTGKTGVHGFDKGSYRIEDVFSAGLSGWMKAAAKNPVEGQTGHVPTNVLLERVNTISETLRREYRLDIPELALLRKHPVSIGDIAVRPFTFLGEKVTQGTGRAIALQPRLREHFAANAPYYGTYVGVHNFGQDVGSFADRLRNLSTSVMNLNEEKRLEQQMVQNAARPFIASQLVGDKNNDWRPFQDTVRQH